MTAPRVVEEREEGGTPDILGSIRLGLVFSMKSKLGSIEVLLYCKGHYDRNILFPDFRLCYLKKIVKYRGNDLYQATCRNTWCFSFGKAKQRKK